MHIRIGIVLALATTAWLTGPLTTAVPAAPAERKAAPTQIRVVPARVLENQPAGTRVGRIVVKDPDRRDRHTVELVRGKRYFEVVGRSLRTTRPLDHEKRPRIRIRLRATDAAGHQVTRRLRVRVIDVNDPPVAVDDTRTTLEDTPLMLPVSGTGSPAENDTDADGDPLTVTGVSGAIGGSVDLIGDGIRFTPAPDHCGPTAGSFDYTVSDGHGHGGVDSGAVAVAITCVTDGPPAQPNEAPVADDESFTGAGSAVGNTSLVVNNLTDGAPDPAGLQKTVTGDLLAGDTDDRGAGALSIAPVTNQATTGGGRVTIEPDGDFTFLPERGCADTTDTFDYTLRDNDAANPLTDTGTVTIAIADCVWYVDADAAAPAAALAGTSQAPYVDLAELDDGGGAGDEDVAGEWLFLADGTYTVASHLLLENDQELYTDRSGLAVGGATLLARDPTRDRSTIVGGVAVGRDNTIQGLDLGDAVNYALTGNLVGNLVMNTETSGDIDNSVGGAVGISGAGNVLDVELDSVETGTLGIDLFGASGSLVVNGGELTSPLATAVELNHSPLDLTLDADITAGNIAVSIEGSGPATQDFNGQVSGRRVYLLNNAGATIRFDGGVNLVSGTSAAFVAAGGGTLAVTDPAGAGNNTLDATTGSPLTVSDTTIHEDDLTFERISSDGAVNGIILERTGSDGGLVVTGAASATACLDGAAGCTGGIITGSSSPGVVLTDVGGGVSLNRMFVGLGDADGVRATTVTGLEIAESVVADNGDAVGELGLDYTAVTGDVTITDSDVIGSADDNLRVSNSSGTATVDVADSSFDESVAGDGIEIAGAGTATMNVVADGISMSSNWGHGLALQTATGAATPTMNLTLRNSDVDDPLGSHGAGSTQLGMYTSGGSTTKVLIEDTTLSDSNGDGLSLQPTQNADLDVTVRRMTIADPFSVGVRSTPSGAAELRLRLDAVTAEGYGASGLALGHGTPGGGGPGSTGTASYIVSSSTLEAGPTASFGLVLSAGDSAADTVWVCGEIGGPGAENQLISAGGPGFADVLIEGMVSSTMQLPDWGPGTVTGYFSGRNLPGLTAADFTGSAPQPVAMCLEPHLPPV